MFTVDEYLDLSVKYLELLNPKIIVERFVSEAPDDLLVAPRWGLRNFEFTDKTGKIVGRTGYLAGKVVFVIFYLLQFWNLIP